MLIYLDNALKDLKAKRAAEGAISPTTISIPQLWLARSSGYARR